MSRFLDVSNLKLTVAGAAALAEKLLAEFNPPHSQIAVVARRFAEEVTGVYGHQLASVSRRPLLVTGRLLWTRALVAAGYSFTATGAMTGGRDHSTIWYAATKPVPAVLVDYVAIADALGRDLGMARQAMIDRGRALVEEARSARELCERAALAAAVAKAAVDEQRRKEAEQAAEKAKALAEARAKAAAEAKALAKPAIHPREFRMTIGELKEGGATVAKPPTPRAMADLARRMHAAIAAARGVAA